MLTTVQGEKLEVAIDGDTVTVGGATVSQPDVAASNGVVHVVDSVLVPSA
jgi:transforming growth factor-beta-induced protein